MTKRASSHPGRTMTAREQMQQRCFSQKQRETILQTLRHALRVKSDADLPKVFQLPVAVALKPGSWEELAARFNVPRDESDPRRRALGSAMAMYCRSRQYGHALLTCDQFFSIDMEPSEPPGSADRERGRTLTGPPSHKGPAPVSRNIRETDKAASPTGPAPADRGRASVPSDRTEHVTGQPADQKQSNATLAGKRKSGRSPPTPMQLRTFHPDHMEKYRARFCKALAVTEENLPAFLAQPFAVPLKIGAWDDLIERYGLKSSGRHLLHTALRGYCRSYHYQHAILNCDTRFSIDMEPDAAITEDARQHAIERLRDLAKRRKARRESRGEREEP
ncbi:MAG: ProQ/FINO family protein [Gammaproteobacteria bacterium]|nr:ProQ/FINO family protein [Gammaproteobacteria bacterium]